jgi:hypothetical protein
MKTIWKYEFQMTDVNTVEMPEDARVLTVQVQNGTICLWAEVDTNNRMEERKFMTCGTGARIKEDPDLFDYTYIGTVQLQHVRRVFHIYEILEEK